MIWILWKSAYKSDPSNSKPLIRVKVRHSSTSSLSEGFPKDIKETFQVFSPLLDFGTKADRPRIF